MNISFLVMKKEDGRIMPEQIKIHDREVPSMKIEVEVRDGRADIVKDELIKNISGAIVSVKQQRVEVDVATTAPAVVLEKIRNIENVSFVVWMGS